jgi:hypothetical protein
MKRRSLMAEFDCLLLAEYARVDPGGLLTVIGGGFDRIVTSSLPAQQPASLAARVSVDEADRSLPLRLTVRAPDSRYVMNLVGSAEQPQYARPHEGKVGVALVVSMMLPLPVAGVYEIFVQLADLPERRLSFVALASAVTC